MEIETIPASILAKHPEMLQISEALASYRESQLVTTKCPKCEQVLKVTDVQEVGSLWVQCPNGHINFHARYTPPAIS
jgi:acetyl-CoA carboxylase beta subunit